MKTMANEALEAARAINADNLNHVPLMRKLKKQSTTSKIIEKIDVGSIRGHWQESGGEYLVGGDDTVKSLRVIAEKVNELVEAYNSIE